MHRFGWLVLASGCGRIGFDVADIGADSVKTVSFGENANDSVRGVTADTRIRACDPFDNYGGATHLHISASGGSCPASSEQVGLLRFELGALPPSTIVLEARLVLRAHGGVVAFGRHAIFRVLESWEEGSAPDTGASGAASWNERLPAVPWTSPGCGAGSCDTTEIGSFLVDQIEMQSVLELTTVQGWIDGSVSNFGIALRSNNPSSSQPSSREEDVEGDRPRLVLQLQ